MEIVYDIVSQFFRLTVSVLPFFVLGVAFGAALETFLKPGFALKYFKGGFLGVLNASILGAVLPGCACATMPVAESIRRRGASLGVVSAFIMAAPLLSPQTVVLTFAMLGWKFTLARIVFSMTGACLIGVAYNALQNRGVKGFTFPAAKPATVCGKCPPQELVEKKSFWKNFLDIAKDLGKYFLIGMFVASLLFVLVPEDAIPRYIGSSGPFAYAVAVLVGVPVYICEGEEIPITLSLLKLGLGTGPAFAFLLGSVGTCIPTMLMAQKIIGKRPTLLYILLWFAFAPAAGLLFSLLA